MVRRGGLDTRCFTTASVHIVEVGGTGWVETGDTGARGTHAPWAAFQPADTFRPICVSCFIKVG